MIATGRGASENFCLDRNYSKRTLQAMQLTDISRRFIVHWGEMGTNWGVNRSVAQIHALLYVHGQPLHAEDIADTLVLARSIVSNSLTGLRRDASVPFVECDFIFADSERLGERDLVQRALVRVAALLTIP